ncbi:CaiB/BaiF CoA-transferase family protein [Pedobacter sp. PLR]|uniref:CaiB/BaiF CoA transferase family protein n=1 Tax=Pedobacter sp. PLR TaxID=2994465 RepID=UPI002246DB71|nr:CaiB/BaiF CoA-transferase family protein [Pedobacter sp. PLR]MCX2452493.1 CaiB/BaiF CoA-transferase family protein [Pedobacter sp. PLR]
MRKPLEGIVVLEFCQFLAGPSAGLKLADLGARVIKIERPGKGDACRQLAIKNLFIEEDSLLFHTINRNKESYAADLKNPEDLKLIQQLIAKADIMTHNFRPGVMEKIGLDYPAVQTLNPKIIYATVTGYGNEGPWVNKPGQDLLIQSVSGMSYLTGSKEDGPVPFGLSVTDIMCGNHLTQGIIAALIKRAKTNKSVLVEVSLLESALDVQFEVLTTYLNDGGQLPERSAVKGSAHAYLSAPYSTYETSEGYIALAMGDLKTIAELIGCDISPAYTNPADSFENRDELLLLLGQKFRENTSQHWLGLLESKDIWCAPVLDYKAATDLDVFKNMEIRQQLDLGNGSSLYTTRIPMQIDGQKLFARKAAPKIGADNDRINLEFELK